MKKQRARGGKKGNDSLRRSRSSHNYFTEVHEKAILDYVSTDDSIIRTDLYREHIGPVFNEMVDKIVFTYRFTTLPNITHLREECKVWLVTVLEKFNPDKAKAFTYFTVVTKNWFIAQVKKKSKRNREELDIYELPKELEMDYLSLVNQYHQDREQEEFILNLKANMIDWQEDAKKPNDEKVLKAIQILLESAEEIEIFNKKAIYLYLRELTGLNTKQVVASLKRIRTLYSDFKINWLED